MKTDIYRGKANNNNKTLSLETMQSCTIGVNLLEMSGASNHGVLALFLRLLSPNIIILLLFFVRWFVFFFPPSCHFEEWWKFCSLFCFWFGVKNNLFCIHTPRKSLNSCSERRMWPSTGCCRFYWVSVQWSLVVFFLDVAIVEFPFQDLAAMYIFHTFYCQLCGTVVPRRVRVGIFVMGRGRGFRVA